MTEQMIAAVILIAAAAIMLCVCTYLGVKEEDDD